MKHLTKIFAAICLFLMAEETMAQCSAVLYVRNIQLKGSRLQWEVHFQPGDKWEDMAACGLGSSSWFFRSTHANLSLPQIVYTAETISSGQGYSTAIGLYRGRVGLTLTLDDVHFSGVPLAADTVYHLITLQADITGSIEAELIWDRINTGIFDSHGRFIREYYIEAETTFPGDSPDLPEAWTLSPNFPNPFNPHTAVLYGIPEESHIELTVYSLLGRQIRRLFAGVQPPGYFIISWDGKDDKGEAVAAGIYILQMRSGAYSQSVRMTMLR